MEFIPSAASGGSEATVTTKIHVYTKKCVFCGRKWSFVCPSLPSTQIVTFMHLRKAAAQVLWEVLLNFSNPSSRGAAGAECRTHISKAERAGGAAAGLTE